MEIDDAYLGGERTGGKVGRGSENKVPFIAAVQTTPDSKPQFMCLRQQPFTNEEVAVFAASPIAPTATAEQGRVMIEATIACLIDVAREFRDLLDVERVDIGCRRRSSVLSRQFD